MLKPLIFCCCLFLLLPASGAAEPTGGCHCFQDREYNQANPFVSDAYLLTSVFNALLAKSYGISKRDIVMMKMKGGVAADDLLLSLYLGSLSSLRHDELLKIRSTAGSWAALLARPDMQALVEQYSLLKKISKGLPDTEAGKAVTDKSIAQYFTIPQELISELRSREFNGREITLLLTLATLAQQPKNSLGSMMNMRGKAGMSWSEICHQQGVAIDAAANLLLGESAGSGGI